MNLPLAVVGLLTSGIVGCHDAPQKNPFDPASGGIKTWRATSSSKAKKISMP